MENSYLGRDDTIHVKQELSDNLFKQEIDEDYHNYTKEDDQVFHSVEKAPKDKPESRIDRGNISVEHSYCKNSVENNDFHPYIKEEIIDIEDTILYSSELVKEEPAAVQDLRCFICGEEFESESQLEEHIKTTHHEQGIVESSDAHQDEIGGRIFAEQIIIPENLGSDNEQVPLRTTNVEHASEREVYECVEQGCGRKFLLKCLLLTHMRLHNNDRPFKCTHENCNKAYVINAHLRKHMRIHSGVRPFKCPAKGCTKSFIYKAGLQSHAWMHFEKMPFKCQYMGCFKGFNTKEALLEHKLAHGEHLPFKCSFKGCPRSFSYEVSLSNHSKSHTIGEETDSNEAKSFKCNFEGCAKEYRAIGSLKDHIRSHNVDNIVKCDIDGCGKSFHSNHALKTHKRKHSDQRPHKCVHPGCEKSFKCNSSLWAHKKTHLTEKKFECPKEGCGKSFTYHKLLKGHMLVHSEGSTSYVCEICSLKFKSKSGLYQHTRKCSSK